VVKVAKHSESRQKTELIQVRATPQEKTDLKARAAQFGVSVGELCRRAIFGAVPKSNTDQAAIVELATTRADLGRLGGLLKGWLAGSFAQPAPALGTEGEVLRLLREIEAAQKRVVEAAQRVAKKP
jgi:hypothetical protein